MALKLFLSQVGIVGEPREVVLNSSAIYIGRSAQNDLCLSHHSISRFHAEIMEQENGDYHLTCLSLRGTLLNTQTPVQNEALLLKDQDELLLPGYRIVFSLQDKKPIETSVDQEVGNNFSEDETTLIPQEALSEMPEQEGTVVFQGEMRNHDSLSCIAKRLAFGLRQAYADVSHKTEIEKKSALMARINGACETMASSEEKKELLVLTRLFFKGTQMVADRDVWPERQKEIVALKTIKTMARSLSENVDLPMKANEIEQFGKHWGKTMSLLIEAFYRTVHFQEQMKAEFPQVFCAPALSSETILGQTDSVQVFSENLLAWKKADNHVPDKDLQDLLVLVQDQEDLLPQSMVESYLDLLESLSPDRLEKALEENKEGGGVKEMMRSNYQKKWKAYLRQHQVLLETLQEKRNQIDSKNN